MNTVQEDKLWQTVLGDIEISLSRANYLTWFKNTHLVANASGRIVIGVPNVFIKQQLERKYNQLILDTIKKNGVTITAVDFKIQSTARPAEIDEKVEQRVASLSSQPEHQPAQHPDRRAINPLTHNYRQGINEHYTFDTFVVGSGNELAYAACQAVAAEVGTKYNPLFLYGGVGIGKTHLIQAVGNAVVARDPRARVVYISSE